ncbi:hypothetical protein [Streptomyces sp. MST-110588]|uniref:hypothetical protein n=1 Tax=Streptomyces sp. MST-110588 TaxID=2833628 RepID=UPI001F5D9F1C|nr:hypothetical protein [Streptomyces sp. MST-110588]UNO42362.1 hypothetical protein KGS77_26100 [Streptomyces sp. MST-110588]
MTEEEAQASVGVLVEDDTGRRGTLREAGDWTDPSTGKTEFVVFVGPVGGGREWTTSPAALHRLERTQ